MTVLCNYLEDVIENVWCPGLCAKLNALFEVIHMQPADFQLQICHPPCYELVPLQYLNFEIVPCKEA